MVVIASASKLVDLGFMHSLVASYQILQKGYLVLSCLALCTKKIVWKNAGKFTGCPWQRHLTRFLILYEADRR